MFESVHHQQDDSTHVDNPADGLADIQVDSQIAVLSADTLSGVFFAAAKYLKEQGQERTTIANVTVDYTHDKKWRVLLVIP